MKIEDRRVEQAWSPWSPLSLASPFTPTTLAETLDGGQAFRWNYDPERSYWQGIWGQNVVRIRLDPTGFLQFSLPEALRSSTSEAQVSAYFNTDYDWTTTVDSLPHRSDPHLAAAIAAFPGLRILKQPFPETVLCFLCSATKQIPQIKEMCERMANALGNPLLLGIHALPTWSELAAASEQDLRSLGLGFRAKNIKKTADLLGEQPTLLADIENAPYADAKAQLMQLPGIGEKIADCALLFGAAQLGAFPVDTWIIKTLEKRYKLKGYSPAQLAQFGRAHYGPHAGLAQQFLFSHERSQT